MVRGYIALAGVAASVAVTAVAATAADENVPKFSNLSAKPARFCAKSSDKCARTGTTIHFTISTPAKVIADIRPRTGKRRNQWGYHEFTRRFPAGPSSVRLNDTRLTAGRWTFRLQGVNSVGASGPTVINLRVIK
jgi:hypothetical protein